MDRPYSPISCTAHDKLLALATLRRECALTLESEGDGPPGRIDGVIVDVYSRAGAEYLQLQDGRTFRLDRLVAIDDQPVPPA